MVAIEATREDFGDPTDTKPVICSCAPGRTRTFDSRIKSAVL
jgi:hypothetical protein